jgi:SAM-dependent methyltransferase
VVKQAGLPAPFRDYASILACPITGEPLRETADGFVNAARTRHYPIENGIPALFAPTDPERSAGDVTDLVKAFYEETPFPNYAEGETRDTLAAKARRNRFVRALDDGLPGDAVVLEAGCGTGQLTNFLGLSDRRRVFGGDICVNSLRLANGFRERHGIANAGFLQMNLFRPPFRDASVDAVIASGVLHHTGNARLGFETLLRIVKPGGVILLGLYNRYARLATLARRWAFTRFGPALHFLDRRLVSGGHGDAQRQAWFRDQYQHPHETRHSIGEVLRWFDAAAVDFVASIPPVAGTPAAAALSLFEPQGHSTAARRLALQLGMLLAGGRDGGLFIVVGRKRIGRGSAGGR